MQGKIEVAIVNGTVVADADLVPAHQIIEDIRIEGATENMDVLGFGALFLQLRPKPADWYIGNGQQVGKPDAPLFVELSAIVAFQRLLIRRKKGPTRILNQIQLQRRIYPVSYGVQLANRFDAFFVYRRTPLGPDVLF